MDKNYFDFNAASEKEDDNEESTIGESATVKDEVGLRDGSGILTRVEVDRVSGGKLIPDVDRRRIEGHGQPRILYSDKNPRTENVEVQLTKHPSGQMRIDAGTRHPQTGKFEREFHGHANGVRVSGAVALFRVNRDDLISGCNNYGSILQEPTCEFICPDCGKRNFRSEHIDVLDRSCDHCGELLD